MQCKNIALILILLIHVVYYLELAIPHSTTGSIIMSSSISVANKMESSSRFVKRIAASTLFVSEPNPSWFGNPGNEASNSAWSNKNWLKSRFHFSFAEYNDPSRSNFGALRVMNDDLVQPKRGFGEHPHRNAEICTYIVNGFLTHKDSMANAETLGKGSLQFMTSGTGVTHSEHNLNTTEPLRFIQMWFTPRRSGLKPAYGSFVGDEPARTNKFAHIVSDTNKTDIATPVKINQDVNIFVTEMDAGLTLPFVVSKNRMAYLLCMEGEVSVVTDNAKTSGSSTSTVSEPALDGSVTATSSSASASASASVTTSAASTDIKLERHDAAHLYHGGAQIAFVNNGEAKNHLLIVEMELS